MKIDKEDNFEQVVSSMKKEQKQHYIDVCLDEFEATADSVRQNKANASNLRAAKNWGKQQKKHLKLLGYHKRMPIIGGKHFTSLIEKSDDI